MKKYNLVGQGEYSEIQVSNDNPKIYFLQRININKARHPTLSAESRGEARRSALVCAWHGQ